ncbi:MAG TPA: VWA domain-containing protein [Ruminococcus sp.]|nr:VWA domain-containing protein [Ruminococcus sp.]
MNKILKRAAASALALTTTAAYMPLAVFSKTFADSVQDIEFEAAQIALYAGSSARLNEKNVSVKGGMYTGDETDYTGSSDKFTVTGARSLGDQNTECELPDYSELINAAEAYDFEFEGDKELFDSVIDLTTSSVYTSGDLKVDHADLRGSGRLSAKGDIDMSVADNSELAQAMIMSEDGDITIDAADLSFTGIIYAPNGKISINAKNIDIVGGIYADSIEINGTSVSVAYKNFFGLECKAHTQDKVVINKLEKLTLSGSVSNEAADLEYSVPASQADKVTIENAGTLSPELSFSASGEYDVTLSADLGNKHASDTIKVIVTDGPVVTYTSTDDFKSGSLDSADGSADELKIAPAKDTPAPKEKKFGNNKESGINVTSKQNKSSINAGGDKLSLDFSLEGYGKLLSGNGNDVILCIDNSGSIAEFRPTIKAAALQIIESMGPNDRLGITSLDRLNTPLTNDKEALITAIDKYTLGGGSDYGNGIKIANDEMFDEDSADRNKYIFLLADGENFGNDDAVALEQAEICRQNGTKIYTFEINPFSSNFSDTSTVQDVAINTNGAYKLCPDADAITKFLLNIADTVYNLAARNITFTTTVTNEDWIKNGAIKKAPDSAVYNDDGSVTLSWNYNTFEIDAVDDIGLDLTTGLITNKGYVQVTRDTKLVSYDSDGNGDVVYLDDIVVGNDGCGDSGKWQSKVFDSGVNSCPWSYVKWDADYYGDSAMDIYLSTSDDGVNFSGRTRVTNGQELDLKGRYLRTEVEMKASEDGATPVLYDLTVYSDETEVSDLRQGADAVIRGGRTVPVDAPVSLWLDIDGKYDSVTDVKWNINGGKFTDTDDSLRRTAVFSKEGDYTVTAEVTAGGIKTETSVVITVLPKTTLWQEIEKEEFKAVKMSLTETPEYATQYQEPLTFNINFEDPEKVAWVRALYKNPTAWGDTYRIAEIKEDEDNLVVVPLPSHNLAETTIVVDAFDWYGNKTTEQRTIKMDRSAPSVGIKSDRSWVYPDNEAHLTVSTSDNDEVAKLALTCNGEEVKLADDNTYTFSNKQPGEYVFEATSADKAGNSSTYKYTVTVRPDEGLPYVNLNGSSRIIIGNSADMKLTAYDNETEIDTLVLSVKKSNEEGEPENEEKELFRADRKNGTIEKENTYKFTPESTGTYVFTLTAADREGNVKQVTYKTTVVADTNGPSINIKLSKSEVLAGESTDVTVTVTDDVAVDHYTFYINDVEAQLSADDTYHFVSDDTNLDKNGTKNDVFKVVAVDTSGNERTATSRLRVLTEDKTQPSVNISSSTRYEYNNDKAYMTVTASDNIKVASLEVTVNGQPVELDADGKYLFDTSELTEYSIVATATDTSGNQKTAEKTVSIVDTTKPVIKVTPDKTSYGTGDSAVLTIDVTDNYKLETVTAELDGKAVETGNGSFTCTIPEAAAGKYELKITAADSSGNAQNTTYTVTVKDTVAPVITASADKETYKKSETPVVKCEYSDNVAVTRVTAAMDGKNLDFDMESGQVVMPADIAPGEKKVTIRAYDAAGNASEPVEVSFTMSSSDDIESPVIEEISVVPEVIRKGNEVTLKVKATDDSGEVILTVTKDGKKLEENAVSGTYTFTADELGEVKLLVRAEDPSGNYTEKEVSLTVYRNTENRKITVEAPSVAKPGEAITVTLSSADGIPFDATELWLGQQDLTSALTQNSDGSLAASFTLDKTGSYSFKAVGKDNDGYSDEKIFDIQVAGTYESELAEPEMQEALKQTSETELSPELKDLAKTFESPTDAYEYVYNNISFEPYSNSRRGAVGAYELKRGNDYDQASLLIGLLREMGYPAKYSDAQILLTSDQLKSLMAVDTFDIGQRIIASNGKNAGIITRTDGSKILKMEEVFVQVFVPASEMGETNEGLKDLGVWAQLDPSIKSSTLVSAEVTPASEETLDVVTDRESYAGTDLGDILDSVEPYVSALTEKTGDSTLSDLFSGPVTVSTEVTYAYGRTTDQKEFNRLPSSLDYQFADENITSFNSVPINKCDTVEFSVSNRYTGKNMGKYKISDVYNKRMTLRFEGNMGGSANIFDMSRNSIYYNTFLPAIYVDGEIASQYTIKDLDSEIGEFIELEDQYYFFGNDSWRLGENCTLTTRITTNGMSTTWTDELNIGSTYSMVFDIGGITESQFNDSLKAAAENNGLDISDMSAPKPAAEAPDPKSYYDEDKIGAYLNFAGNYYFLSCDAYGSTTASMNNIELGGHTKMLMTAYRTNSLEDEITHCTLGMLPGRFMIDVSYNTGITFSRSGDTDARNDYMFNVSYMESYYEGSIWDDLLLTNGVSTVEVFNKAAEEGIGLININADNIDTELAKAELDADEISEIRSSVEKGYSVIVPEKRVTINKWSGTGYIIADFVGYDHFVFKLSGGTNGGSEDEDTDLFGDDMAQKLVDLNVDIDRLYTGLFTGAQSMYYILLEFSIGVEFNQAVATLSAASGGGIIPVFLGGMELYRAAKHLADIIGYRVTLLETFYDYCMAETQEDQAKACVAAMNLIVEMLKDMKDILLGMLSPDDSTTADQIKEGLKELIKDTIGIYAEEDEDRDDLIDHIVDEVVDAADSD